MLSNQLTCWGSSWPWLCSVRKAKKGTGLVPVGLHRHKEGAEWRHDCLAQHKASEPKSLMLAWDTKDQQPRDPEVLFPLGMNASPGEVIAELGRPRALLGSGTWLSLCTFEWGPKESQNVIPDNS